MNTVNRPCIGCIYFDTCGETTRTEPCSGRVTRTEQKKNINHICFNCQKLFNGCNGTTNKVYTGCIFKTTNID